MSSYQWRLCAILLPLSVTAWAADTPAPVKPVNPAVVAKVVQMGEYLRSLPKYQLDSQITSDVVIDDGYKLTTHGTARVRVNGKAQLNVRLDTDAQHRVYFYNGAGHNDVEVHKLANYLKKLRETQP